MARTFNYQRATIEQIAAHITTVQRQTYIKTLKYYQKLNYTEIVEKLLAADKINYKNSLVKLLEGV